MYVLTQQRSHLYYYNSVVSSWMKHQSHLRRGDCNNWERFCNWSCTSLNYQKILDAIKQEVWCIWVVKFVAILIFNNQLGGGLYCQIICVCVDWWTNIQLGLLLPLHPTHVCFGAADEDSCNQSLLEKKKNKKQIRFKCNFQSLSACWFVNSYEWGYVGWGMRFCFEFRVGCHVRVAKWIQQSKSQLMGKQQLIHRSWKYTIAKWLLGWRGMRMWSGIVILDRMISGQHT